MIPDNELVQPESLLCYFLVPLSKQIMMSSNEILDSIEIEPAAKATTSVIWLHGLGADGSDFASIVPELKLPPSLNIRFIFPHAPVMPITINNGYEMRAWFDIHGLTVGSKVDTAGIAASITAIHALIEREISHGIATNEIILAGFSQGAAMALITGLTYPKPLAGIIALSGFLPLAGEVLQKASTANQHIPIFMAHGTEDAIVSYAFGNASHTVLQQANYPVTWHDYRMAHTVCRQEIDDISLWLQTLIHDK